MNRDEVFEVVRPLSVFRVLTKERAQALLAESEILFYESGQEIIKSRHPDALYVVLQGRVAQLAPEDHSIHRGSVTHGHSLELKTILSGDQRWSYDWITEEPASILRILKPKLMKVLEAEPELLDYLLKITLNPELQRLRNDMRLCGFDSLDIQKTISALRRTDRTFEEGSSLLILKSGGVSVHQFSNGDMKETGHYISGDYLFFEGNVSCSCEKVLFF